MAMPMECFLFGTACSTIILQWPLAQLFLAAWAGSTGQCSVYLSEMSMNITFWSWPNFVTFHLVHERNILLCINIAVAKFRELLMKGKLSVILLSGILLCGMLISVILLRVILLSGILLSFSLIKVFHLRTIQLAQLNAILINVIVNNVVAPKSCHLTHF
jgi:hypothetical protein